MVALLASLAAACPPARGATAAPVSRVPLHTAARPPARDDAALARARFTPHFSACYLAPGMDELKAQLKQLIIDELHLADVQPKDIADDAPLFGAGLGLDSLDALQLAVAVEEHYGVRIADEGEGKKAFASIDALAAHVAARRAPA